MTAVSLIVQRSAAHLLTDGALYGSDGTLLEVVSKVTRCPARRMALAVSGSLTAYRLAEAIGSFDGQDAALAALPAAARHLRDENRQLQPSWEAAEDDLNGFQIAGVAWSDRLARPLGFILATNSAWMGGNYQAFTLAPVDQMLSPPPAQLAFTLDTFHPRRHGRALFAEQRRYRDPATGASFVGGFGEVTTVDRNGVRQERLVTWPDRVGELIAA